LLDRSSKALTAGDGIVLNASDETVTIPKPGIYQVDVYPVVPKPVPPDASRLTEGLTGAWPTEALDSPDIQPINAPLTIPRSDLPTDDARHVGEGDFSLSAWIKPKELGRHSIVTLGTPDRTR